MPVMNDYEATAAIRSLPGDGISRQESGMNDHVAKPIDMNVLLPTIMKYM